jgi:hypothetical protein
VPSGGVATDPTATPIKKPVFKPATAGNAQKSAATATPKPSATATPKAEKRKKEKSAER